VSQREGAGLLAALFMALVPSYMSRSVGGSYDNEAVAIFFLLITFYMFVRAANLGSMLWALGSSFCYFAMAASWGGYSFIINIVPIFVLGLLIADRYNSRVYLAYTVFYVFGTIMAMQIQFVRFLAVSSSEHMASHGVFLILQLHALLAFARRRVAAGTL
jgi:dolichyl-diphosphooligosaccharide---protein glycosyltransferase